MMMGGLMLAVFRWPAAAVAGVFCTYGIEQWAQSNSSFFASHSALTNYLTASTLLIALSLRFLRGERVLSGYPAVGWAIIALFGYALASVVWSVYPTGTTQQWSKHWPYITIFVVMCPLLIIEGRDLRDGLFAFLALGTVVVTMLAFTTVLQGRFVQLSSGVGIGALASDKGNPLAIASLAGYVIIVALMMNFRGMARFWQLSRWYIVAIGLMVSIRTGSRGQLFALLIVVLVFLPLSRRMKSIRGFVAGAFGLLVVGGIAAWAHSMFAVANRWQWDTMIEAYSAGRLGSSMKVLQYWADSSPHAWIIGLGNSASFDPFILGFYPHVVLIEVLVEEGVVGFFLLWAVVILAFRAMVRTYSHAVRYDDARGALAAMGALFLFEVVLSFKQGSLLGNTGAFAFAIILGRFELAASRAQVNSDEPTLTPVEAETGADDTLSGVCGS